MLSGEQFCFLTFYVLLCFLTHNIITNLVKVIKIKGKYCQEGR